MKNINHLSFVVENTEFTVFMQRERFVTGTELLSSPHLHALGELHMMLEGSATIEGDFDTAEIKDCRVCVIPPLTYHSTVDTSKNTADRIDMGFMIKRLNKVDFTVDMYEIMKPMFKQNSRFLKFKVDPMVFEELKTSVNICGGVFSKMTPMQKIKIKNIFSLFFISLAEQMTDAHKTPPGDIKTYTADSSYYCRLIHAEHLFQSYAKGEIGFNGIADKLHLCGRQLSNIIKHEYKKTAKTIFFEMRIKTAAQLMRRCPDMPVYQVAERVGYSSSDALSVMFKKYYGVTATEYKAIRNSQFAIRN